MGKIIAPYYCGFTDFVEATANVLKYTEVSPTTLTQSHITFCFKISPICFSIISAMCKDIRGCIQKFPDRVNNEVNINKPSLGSNKNGYGGKTH
jgi:hypothetical protein